MLANKDDLDAPDLLSPAAPETEMSRPTAIKKDRLNGSQGQSAERGSGGHRGKAGLTTSRPKLAPVASAALREQLTAQVTELKSAEDAAKWAHRVLGAKNTLTAVDAEHVEQAFQSRLTLIPGEISREGAEPPTGRRKRRSRATVVNKSVLALPAPRRIRDREHVKAVARQPCLICGRQPADAHHLRFAQSPALGRKVSDEFTVPLCRGHHRELHHCGDEAAWWNKIGIDPTGAARVLWLKSHPLLRTANPLESKL
jgi:hypothetical protein